MNRVVMWSSGSGRLGYVAGFGVMWFQLRCRVLVAYVLLDQADAFSSPVVPFAMGLNVVASWGGGFVNYGPVDVCGLVCWV